MALGSERLRPVLPINEDNNGALPGKTCKDYGDSAC